MRFLQMGSRMLSRTSPLGLIAGGMVAALAVPAVRKGLRRAAVVTLSGILSLTDEAKQHSAASRQKIQELIDEAKSTDHKLAYKKLKDNLKEQPRRMAVAATAGVLAASDKAKGLAHNASHGLKTVVADARELRNQNSAGNTQTTEIKDGLEGEFTDLPEH